MNKPPIIGLLGYAGSGKDTVYRVAGSLLPTGNVYRFAFADILKHEVATAHGVTVEYINRNKADYRAILQEWGQEKRRQDPDYWIGLLGGAMIGCPGELAFITDVRYLNEANWIRREGGILVRVVREGVGPLNEHSSEKENELIVADYLLENPGDDRLKGKVASMLYSFGWLD